MQTNKWPLIIGGFVLFAVIAAEIYLILELNSGTFTYTLDDPYIHLALADQIAIGHYGLNGSEFSAPSSSILWPFMLAIISWLPLRHLHPLFLNLIFAAGTLFVIWRIISISIQLKNQTDRLFFTTLLLLVISLGSNLPGIVLTGMEHTSQLFFVVLIVWGLILYLRDGDLRWWLLVAVVVSPLIRYENLPLSGGVILFLLLENRIKPALLSGGLIAICLAGFSLFLLRLDLWILPTSVVAKTTSGESVSIFQTILEQFQEIFAEGRAILLLVMLLIILARLLISSDGLREQKFVGVIGLSIVAHLLFGKYGWYHRYEIYIWATAIVSAVYLYRDGINRFLDQPQNTKWGLLITLVLFLTCSAPYLYGLTTIPTAANNIYQQHFQMHRFVTDFYQAPVAVNDVGYVAFENDNYVLDLWGLASTEALTARQTSESAEWMVDLTSEYEVDAVMIYEEAFRSGIPDEWIKVGELTTSRSTIIVHDQTVDFFATNQTVVPSLKDTLGKFAETLPADVQFELVDN